MAVAVSERVKAEVSVGVSAPLLLHPGEILFEEYMIPLEVTKYRLAQETGLSESHIGELVSGKRNITATTALRLAAYCGNSPEFWLNLQTHYDLTREKSRLQGELQAIRPNPQMQTAFAEIMGR